VTIENRGINVVFSFNFRKYVKTRSVEMYKILENNVAYERNLAEKGV